MRLRRAPATAAEGSSADSLTSSDPLSDAGLFDNPFAGLFDTAAAPGAAFAGGIGADAANHWLRIYRGAMACRFEVTLSGEEAPRIATVRAALREADRLEAALTVFRESSDLMRVNRTAAHEPAPVDDELFALLDRCRTLHAETEGAFDITSTPLSRCWGFLRRDPRAPSAPALAAARSLVGMHQVHLRTIRPVAMTNRAAIEGEPAQHEPAQYEAAESEPAPRTSPPEHPRSTAPLVATPHETASQGAASQDETAIATETIHTVRFARPGIELNLGSIGKGYAVQRIGDRLRARGLRQALVSAGGSSVLAIGGAGDGWPIHLRAPACAATRADDRVHRARVDSDASAVVPDDFENDWPHGLEPSHAGASSAAARASSVADPDEPFVRVWLRDGALATSGAGEQFVEVDGRRYGHVLDPRTGWPAEGLLSATVITRDAADADALSTAFLVGGLDLARRYVEAHPGTLAILTEAADPRCPHVIGHYAGARVEPAHPRAHRRQPSQPVAASAPASSTVASLSLASAAEPPSRSGSAARSVQSAQSAPSARSVRSESRPEPPSSSLSQPTRVPDGTARRGAS